MKPLLIDSNVAFIATGQIGEAWAAVILEEAATGKFVGATDVLHVQELLEVYYSAGEYALGKRIARSFRKLMHEVLPVTVQDFDKSLEIFKRGARASPRDLLHSAVMLSNGISRIFCIDGPRLEEIPGIERVRLQDLLGQLGLKGNYIHDRTQ